MVPTYTGQILLMFYYKMIGGTTSANLLTMTGEKKAKGSMVISTRTRATPTATAEIVGGHFLLLLLLLSRSTLQYALGLLSTTRRRLGEYPCPAGVTFTTVQEFEVRG